jgi:hypothetical protein
VERRHGSTLSRLSLARRARRGRHYSGVTVPALRHTFTALLPAADVNALQIAERTVTSTAAGSRTRPWLGPLAPDRVISCSARNQRGCPVGDRYVPSSTLGFVRSIAWRPWVVELTRPGRTSGCPDSAGKSAWPDTGRSNPGPDMSLRATRGSCRNIGSPPELPVVADVLRAKENRSRQKRWLALARRKAQRPVGCGHTARGSSDPPLTAQAAVISWMSAMATANGLHCGAFRQPAAPDGFGGNL